MESFAGNHGIKSAVVNAVCITFIVVAVAVAVAVVVVVVVVVVVGRRR